MSGRLANSHAKLLAAAEEALSQLSDCLDILPSRHAEARNLVGGAQTGLKVCSGGGGQALASPLCSGPIRSPSHPPLQRPHLASALPPPCAPSPFLPSPPFPSATCLLRYIGSSTKSIGLETGRWLGVPEKAVLRPLLRCRKRRTRLGGRRWPLSRAKEAPRTRVRGAPGPRGRSRLRPAALQASLRAPG